MTCDIINDTDKQNDKYMNIWTQLYWHIGIPTKTPATLNSICQCNNDRGACSPAVMDWEGEIERENADQIVREWETEMGLSPAPLPPQLPEPGRSALSSLLAPGGRRTRLLPAPVYMDSDKRGHRLNQIASLLLNRIIFLKSREAWAAVIILRTDHCWLSLMPGLAWLHWQARWAGPALLRTFLPHFFLQFASPSPPPAQAACSQVTRHTQTMHITPQAPEHIIGSWLYFLINGIGIGRLSKEFESILRTHLSTLQLHAKGVLAMFIEHLTLIWFFVSVKCEMYRWHRMTQDDIMPGDDSGLCTCACVGLWPICGWSMSRVRAGVSPGLTSSYLSQLTAAHYQEESFTL